MHKHGLTVAEVAKAQKVGTTTIYGWIRNYSRLEEQCRTLPFGAQRARASKSKRSTSLANASTTVESVMETEPPTVQVLVGVYEAVV